MRFCKGCNRFLTSNHFHKNRTTKHGLASRCKSCVKKDRDRVMTNDPTYKERQRKTAFKTKYKLPLEKIEKLKEELKNSCMICGAISKLVVDHNHVNNRLRGLVCDRCNLVLIPAAESMFLEKAIAYVLDDGQIFTKMIQSIDEGYLSPN